MPAPPPFSPEEREYYENFKLLLREQLPGGRRLVDDLHAAYEQFFRAEGIILSRRDRHRLFQLIMDELLAEMRAAVDGLEP